MTKSTGFRASYVPQTRREKLDIANAKRPVHHKPSRFEGGEHHTLIGQALREAGYVPKYELDEEELKRRREQEEFMERFNKEPRSP